MDQSSSPPYCAEPPLYGAESSTQAAYPSEKKERDDQESCEPVAPVASTSAQRDDLELGNQSQSIIMHVYKDRTTALSRDVIVKAEDKVTELFYLHHPHHWSGAWTMALCRGTKDGPSVAQITKASLKHPKTITMIDAGPEFVLSKPGMLGHKHEFWLRGERYEWKPNKTMGQDLTLRKFPSNGQIEVVASWSQSYLALSKDGKLSVGTLYLDDLDLIVATALAMEVWQNEQD